MKANMVDVVERLRDDARSFREKARIARPHPANPHKINAGEVARFVDVSCAYVALEMEEAADTIERLRAERDMLRINLDTERAISKAKDLAAAEGE